MEIIIFWVLLVGSLGANLMAWCGSRWYMRHFNVFARWFPPSRGWALLYLALVLWIGSLVGAY